MENNKEVVNKNDWTDIHWYFGEKNRWDNNKTFNKDENKPISLKKRLTNE